MRVTHAAHECRRQALDMSIVEAARVAFRRRETKPRAVKHRLAKGCAGDAPRTCRTHSVAVSQLAQVSRVIVDYEMMQ